MASDVYVALIQPRIRDGYVAGRLDVALDANPYPSDSVAGAAWSFGWKIATLPWFVRVLLGFVPGVDY